MSDRAPRQGSGPRPHPIDVLLREIARTVPARGGAAADHGRPDLAGAVEAAGGQGVVNLAAAFVTVLGEQGTVLGPTPPERLKDLWTLQVCHHIAERLKWALSSRDPSGETWRRFVGHWERAHLEPHGYFRERGRA